MQKNIGERLRMVRGGVSREVFAERYGIHPNTLARWERNERTPLDSVLSAVAAGEKINPDWLKMGRGEIVYQEGVEDPKLIPGIGFEVREDAQPLEISQPEKTKPIPGISFAAPPPDVLGRLLAALDDNAALLREIADLREARARLEARVRELESALSTHTHTRAGGMTAAPSGDG